MFPFGALAFKVLLAQFLSSTNRFLAPGPTESRTTEPASFLGTKSMYEVTSM